MADTFTDFLKLPEPKPHEMLLEEFVKLRNRELSRAVAGYLPLSLAGSSGALDLTPAQARVRVLMLSGNPAAAVTLRVPHDTGANADIVVVNGCGGAFSSVTFKSTGANAGNPAGVVIPAGETWHIRHDGESAYPITGGGSGPGPGAGAFTASGVVTLVPDAEGATATVLTSATGIVFYNGQDENVRGSLSITRIPGTSFTITSSEATDSGVVGWGIV